MTLHHLKYLVPVIIFLLMDGMAHSAETTPSFLHEIMPLLTKHGCNQGACHGKGNGQNGFRLSLRGYAPEMDHAWLTREFLARRIDTADPAESLIVRKAMGEVPHEGGRLFSKNSRSHQVMVQWLKAGMPGPSKNDAKLTGLKITPAAMLLAKDKKQQVNVIAEFSDNKKVDVTWLAKFAVADSSQLNVDADGMVTALRPGETSVQVFFEDQVAIATFTTPYQNPIPIASFPKVINPIDDAVFKKLSGLGIPPSLPCNDEVFLRRLFLDTAGILPNASEVTSFLADKTPNKRASIIDKVLDRPEFVDFWTLQLADIFQNRKERDHDVRGTKGVRAFHSWLHDQVRTNKPWDLLCSEILTSTGNTSENPSVGYFIVTVGEQREAHRSEVVASMAQSFLGTRIGCAQCHNHPLEKYTQDDFYRFSGFFSRLRLDRKDPKDGVTTLFANLKEDEQKRPLGVTQPRTGEFLTPRPIDRTAVETNKDTDPRLALAKWMTDPSNESFHGAFVNRVWKHFMGTGLVEPVDDLRSSNPPSNKELWAYLKNEFIRSKCDTRHLIRLVLYSQTYQLESGTVPGNETDTRFYSHYYPKRLGAEVILDAVSFATGVPESFPGYPEGIRAVQVPDPGIRSYFLSVFGRSERVTACACERSEEVSLPQLLHLQNGQWISEKMGNPKGKLKALIADNRSDNEKIKELFLTTISRLPTEVETAALVKELAKSTSKDEFYQDAFWALLNTVEFSFNH
jgi:Protein of unknown function (DUF1553)/Protein of unknown function (DUF1549)/Bacterial Ig-like domain (group 2)